MDGEAIRICREHGEYPTPMIGTCAFDRAEKWCPFCDWTTGSFFSDLSVEVPATPELVERHQRYDHATRAHLRMLARGEGSEWQLRQKAEELPPVPRPTNVPQCVCDGCGKITDAERGRRGLWDKPSHWYSREDEDGCQVACSRACIQVVAEKSGKTGATMPW